MKDNKMEFNVTVTCDFDDEPLTVSGVLHYFQNGDFEIVSIIPDTESDNQKVLIKLLEEKGV
jgi:hypothetical protein